MKLIAQIARVARLLFAALREVFDEAGYERFLARHGLPANRTSYQQFCREHEYAMVSRPRCC